MNFDLTSGSLLQYQLMVVIFVQAVIMINKLNFIFIIIEADWILYY